MTNEEKNLLVIKDLFLNVKSVKKINVAEKITSDILKRFKKTVKGYTFKSLITLNWLPLNQYLAKFVNYYKDFYQLENLKRTDSTLKNQFKELTENTSFYIIKFDDDSTYKIVIFE